MTPQEAGNGQLDYRSDIGSRELLMYINGEWVDSESGERFVAHNPATGEEIASLPLGTRGDAVRAIEAARARTDTMRLMTAWERSELCSRIAGVIEERADELARVLTIDQGKPYT